MEQKSEEMFEDYADGAEETQIDEYDITSSPNDFNVLTLNSFIESGAVKIPAFQRNYVWDKGRASKLIESLILGLPVPQLFLYEKSRNEFLVIDGQQRLMSIFYFMKQRFPRKSQRSALRKIFDEKGNIPNDVLHDDSFFENFRLQLPKINAEQPNKFSGLNYSTLGEYKTQFELRPIRNVIVKQNSPKDDDTSMFEIFGRLNTGGINLRPQEIRTSMYHSAFYEMLYRVNTMDGWRRLLGTPTPDLHMKDIQVVLRGFAMLIDHTEYAPSMVQFLNKFSKKCLTLSSEHTVYLGGLFESFIKSCDDLPDDAFMGKKIRRFNIALFESVFTAVCGKALPENRKTSGSISVQSVDDLVNDPVFIEASEKGTTSPKNVDSRLKLGEKYIEAL